MTNYFLLKYSDFIHHLEHILPDFRQKKFLLAVSGGVDSMVLCHFFQHEDLYYEVAHVNYHLRDEDSNKDQQLVEGFCNDNDIPFHLLEVQEKPKGSLQNWAREIRYQFFNNLLENHGLDYIATAHHLNDELETFFINLSKAAGIKGLSGIPNNENRILRPMLTFTKEDIYDFAEENNITFREDISNTKNDYLRNKFRNLIIPNLQEVEPNFFKNFGKSIAYLRQAEEFIENKIEEEYQSIIIQNQNVISIDKQKLSEKTDFVKFEILRKFGLEDQKEIQKIFLAESGKIFLSEHFQLLVDRERLILSPRKKEEDISQEIIIPENGLKSPVNISFTENEESPVQWSYDTDKITFPLKIRKKKTGDIFFPKGMKGKKKVSKFFRDEKISQLKKTEIWLLSDASDNVLGVIPFRQDKRFLPDEKTNKYLNIYL